MTVAIMVTGDVDRHPQTWATSSRNPVPVAKWSGISTLIAFLLHLVGTKWASYIPGPIPGVYLAETLLVVGAALGGWAGLAHRDQWIPPSALAAIAPAAIYVLYRGLEAAFDPSSASSLWLRDMAPLLYLILIPFTAVGLRSLPFKSLLSGTRLATAIMGLVVLGQISGLLSPIDFGTEVPAFTSRSDVDNVVLGIGIVAFGGWGRNGRSHPVMQVALFSLAAANYSRAGLLAASVCAAIALWRARRSDAGRDWMVGLGLVACAILGLTLTLAANVRDAMLGATPEAVTRLLQSDVTVGTTGARLAAWDRLLEWVVAGDRLLLGFGPGSEPVTMSGAVYFLSGSEEVRAAHNWLITAIAYHGILGLVAWILAIAIALRSASRIFGGALVIAGILGYASAGVFGVVVESPFGSLPMSVFAAWAIGHFREAGDSDLRRQSHEQNH